MVNAVPEGYHTMTPHLSCTPCTDAIDFYRKAFGAESVGDVMTGPDGSVGHAEMQIGDSRFMLADEWPGGPVKSPTSLGASTSSFMLYVDNVRDLWDRAIAAGCTEVFPLEMQFYGDLSGRVKDPFGHTWGLAEHVEDITDEEMEKRSAQWYEDNPPAS